MRAEAIAAAIARASARGGAILCYHSLVVSGTTSQSIANLSVEEFLAHVDAIRSVGEIVPLSTLLARHERGARTARSFALTFDDAYASLSSIRQTLVSERVPVTVFVSTDAVVRQQRFWWDRVEDVYPHVTPERWRQFEDAVGVPESYRLGQPRTLGPIRPLRQWILGAHRGHWSPELEPALAHLERDASFSTAERPMTFEELGEFAANDLVEIGVHTRTHPVLPLLTDDDIREEITGCHAILREHFQRTQPVLAFPFGLFDERSSRIAHDAGMTFALTLGNRLLPFELPYRVLPRLSMSRGFKNWKLLLHLGGVAEAVRAYRGRLPSSYPALPSART